MEYNNTLPDKNIIEPVDNSQLSYNDNEGVSNPVGEVTDKNTDTNRQYGSNEASALNNMHKPRGKSASTNVDNMNQSEDVINIQIPYNPNRPMEPELWDGNFQPILLHGLLE